METKSSKESEDNANNTEQGSYEYENEHRIYDSIETSDSPDFWTKDNRIKLVKLNEALGGKKVDLFKISTLNMHGKLDLAKLVNDENDDNIDLWKHSRNIVDGKIDLAKFTNSKKERIDLSKLTGVINKEGGIDFTKIFDSDTPTKINLKKINISEFCHCGKVVLSKISKPEDNIKVDLFEIPECLSLGKIDLSKLKNSQTDNQIDLIKYTKNITNGKVDLNLLTDSQSNKMDARKINGLFDDKDRLDLYKVCDSNLNGEIDLSMINFNFTSEIFKKIALSSLTDSGHNGKINLLKLNEVNVNGRIDINRVCNSFNDNKLNLFKYTRNFKDGQIDLNAILDSSGEAIDVYRLDELIDDHDRMDLAKITDSSSCGVIDLSKTNFRCINTDTKMYRLINFIDSKNDHKIDLYRIKNVIVGGKIDINKICIDNDNKKVDFFKYTRNLENGQIDLNILTDSSGTEINVNRLSGLINDKDQMDLSKITDTRFFGAIDIDKTTFKCYGINDKKILIAKFIDSSNYDGRINLFKILNVINKGKIDITKIKYENNSNKLCILKCTTHQQDGKILIDSFRNGNYPYMYLSSFDELTDWSSFTQSKDVGKVFPYLANGPRWKYYYYKY